MNLLPVSQPQLNTRTASNAQLASAHHSQMLDEAGSEQGSNYEDNAGEPERPLGKFHKWLFALVSG